MRLTREGEARPREQTTPLEISDVPIVGEGKNLYPVFRIHGLFLR